MCLLNTSLVSTGSFSDIHVHSSLGFCETAVELVLMNASVAVTEVMITWGNNEGNRMLDFSLSSIKCYEVNRLGSSSRFWWSMRLVLHWISCALQDQVRMQNDCEVCICFSQPCKAHVSIAKYDVLAWETILLKIIGSIYVYILQYIYILFS